MRSWGTCGCFVLAETHGDFAGDSPSRPCARGDCAGGKPAEAAWDVVPGVSHVARAGRLLNA